MEFIRNRNIRFMIKTLQYKPFIAKNIMNKLSIATLMHVDLDHILELRMNLVEGKNYNEDNINGKPWYNCTLEDSTEVFEKFGLTNSSAKDLAFCYTNDLQTLHDPPNHITYMSNWITDIWFFDDDTRMDRKINLMKVLEI